MKVIVGTKEEVVSQAAQRYVDLLAKKPDAVLGLATGSTPLGLYAELARLCAEGKLSFAEAKSFNLDDTSASTARMTRATAISWIATSSTAST